MQIYPASKLVWLSEHLQSARLSTVDNESFSGSRNEVRERLIEVAKEADDIFLPLTAILARRLAEDAKTSSANELFDGIQELDNRLFDEIKSVRFLLVNADKQSYYQNTELAGSQFKANFPTGNTELIEAGNCYALDRHTACVFHLMRALDIGLATLERCLGITPPTSGPQRTWGRTLARIRDKMEQNDKNPAANWVTERDFYEQANAFLRAVKSPFRDATMHVKATYDEESARDVFLVTVVVLRHLATKLAE